MRRLSAPLIRATVPLARLQSSASSSSGDQSGIPTTSAAKAPNLQGIKLDKGEGISGFDGFLDPGKGTFNAFVNPKKSKQGLANEGALPCDVPNSEASLRAEQAARMAEVELTGKLPSPAGAAPKRVPTPTSAEPKPIQRSSLPAKSKVPLPSKPAATSPPKPGNSPIEKPLPNIIDIPDSSSSTTVSSEVEDYYKSIPRQEVTKEEMWNRIQQAGKDTASVTGTAIDPTQAEYLKMEEELQEHDVYHFRIGELAFPDETKRRDYYAMWQLAMSLNKARWTMLDIHSQRGVKSTGAGLKLLFWKESIYQIAEKKEMPMGQFVDSHPVLRPFAAAVNRAGPRVTKTFIRGWADARLKVLQQPGNVKQLFDHFDKFYGFFFNTMLEVLDVKDDHAEHAMCHIGRAIGLTHHCVLFWKKYAKVGFTMLPADMCADHCVNLTLLKNIPLAQRDRAVRHLLCDVMAIAKEEMMHAKEAVKHCPPKMWPILTECFYPNYYLGFLQKHDFNVSANLADHNIENPGYVWYRWKKRMEWERYQSLERLVDEPAPIPYIGTSYGHRGSKYQKLAVDGKGVAPGKADCGHNH